ncbi:MAG: hypothetical protein ABSB26_03810 [Nitrososphaerales archaeon]|jgi:hypothetical protein
MEAQTMRRVRLEKGLPELREGLSVAGLGEGTLTLTNDTLLFTDKNGRSVGCDLGTMRSISIPERRILAVAFSAGGKIETLQFDFKCEIPHHETDRPGSVTEQRSEAERFCVRLHTLAPDVPVVGYRTMKDEEWREKMERVRKILATEYNGPYGERYWETWNPVMEFITNTNCHEFMWTIQQAIEVTQLDADRFRKDLEIIARGEMVDHPKEEVEQYLKNCEEFLTPLFARYGELHV